MAVCRWPPTHHSTTSGRPMRLHFVPIRVFPQNCGGLGHPLKVHLGPVSQPPSSPEGTPLGQSRWFGVTSSSWGCVISAGNWSVRDGRDPSKETIVFHISKQGLYCHRGRQPCMASTILFLCNIQHHRNRGAHRERIQPGPPYTVRFKAFWLANTEVPKLLSLVQEAAIQNQFSELPVTMTHTRGDWNGKLPLILPCHTQKPGPDIEKTTELLNKPSRHLQ